MATLEELVSQATTLTNVITDRLVVPLLIIFAGVIVGRIIRNSVVRLCKSIDLDKSLEKKFGQSFPVTELIAGGFAAVVYTVALVWALFRAEVLLTTIQILGILILILGIVALGVHFSDWFPNAFIRRKVSRRLKVGQVVHAAGVSGKVERIGFAGTRLSSKEGTFVVPHSTLLKERGK